MSALCFTLFRYPFCSIWSFFSKDKIFMSILCCYYSHESFLPTYLFIFLTSNVLRGIWVLLAPLHSSLHFAPFDHFFSKNKIFMSILYCHYFHQNFLPTYLFIFLTSNVLRGIWVLLALLHSVLHFVPSNHFSRKTKFSCPSCTVIIFTKIFFPRIYLFF